MDGKKVEPWDLTNPIALVPQFGCLCGELTAREVTRDTANMKHNLSKEGIDKEVQEIMDKLGLSHVADGIIGTILFVSVFQYFNNYIFKSRSISIFILFSLLHCHFCFVFLREESVAVRRNV